MRFVITYIYRYIHERNVEKEIFLVDIKIDIDIGHSREYSLRDVNKILIKFT